MDKNRAYLVSILTPLRDLLDPEKCAAVLAAEFHPEGAICPGCRAPLSEKRAATWRAGRRVKCLACGKQFTAWQGTPFQGAHMSPAEFILFRVALAAGLDHTGLQQLLGRHGQFVRAWARKIQELNSSLAGNRPTTANAGEPLSPPAGSTADDQAAELLPLDLDLASLRLAPPLEGLHLDRLDHERDPKP